MCFDMLREDSARETGFSECGNCPTLQGEYKAKMLCYAFGVDEGRKRTLGIIAAILLPPKASDWSAIGLAEKILRVIDSKYPAPK